MRRRMEEIHSPNSIPQRRRGGGEGKNDKTMWLFSHRKFGKSKEGARDGEQTFSGRNAAIHTSQD